MRQPADIMNEVIVLVWWLQRDNSDGESRYTTILNIPQAEDVERYLQVIYDRFFELFDLVIYYLELSLVLFSVVALLGAGGIGFMLYRRFREHGFGFAVEQEKVFYNEVRGGAVQPSQSMAYSESVAIAHEHILEYHACLEVLGLSVGSGITDIKQAYRELARQFHPDTRTHDEAFEDEKFQVIKRAYEALLSLEREHSVVTLRATEMRG